jgi:hypothetical protein
MKKIVLYTLLWITLLFGCKQSPDGNVRGWIILSNHQENAEITIRAAKNFNINHLQLSHHIVHSLREVKDEKVREQVNNLTRLAYREGIKDVFVWDRSFYALNYYPDEFKTGPDGTLDLDNPLFWEWFKNDYREMLDLVPEIDGLILTFIETGARAERQYSEKMKSNQEKLAAVVNAVADVVIDERNLQLYIRTFSYTYDEYANTIGCIEYIKNPDVRLMMKETPHDFFLTHPDNRFIGTIDRPTIVEFDTGNEFNGQGVIANTWPDYVLRRWRNFIRRPNVIGYVARTDRYGDTKIVDTPHEILLFALKRATENPAIIDEEVYDEFIVARYGKEALEPVKEAFKMAYDIVTSSLYTLGTNVANHSAMDYDRYTSSYFRHVSGKWLNPPVVFVEHGVNKQFHYWKEVIDHIAPARHKTKDGPLSREVRYVLDQDWVEAVEKMDSVYLQFIITEKKYGVDLAKKALSLIESAKPALSLHHFDELHQLFLRTYLTAQLYEAVATVYYGYRVYARGVSYQPAGLVEQIETALEASNRIVGEMKIFEGKHPVGQWNWLRDTEMALSYKDRILNGWQEYDNTKLPARSH